MLRTFLSVGDIMNLVVDLKPRNVGRQSKHIHLRQCKICDRIYRTYRRQSKKCDNCKGGNPHGYVNYNEIKVIV